MKLRLRNMGSLYPTSWQRLVYSHLSSLVTAQMSRDIFRGEDQKVWKGAGCPVNKVPREF